MSRPLAIPVCLQGGDTPTQTYACMRSRGTVCAPRASPPGALPAFGEVARDAGREHPGARGPRAGTVPRARTTRRLRRRRGSGPGARVRRSRRDACRPERCGARGPGPRRPRRLRGEPAGASPRATCKHRGRRRGPDARPGRRARLRTSAAWGLCVGVGGAGGRRQYSRACPPGFGGPIGPGQGLANLQTLVKTTPGQRGWRLVLTKDSTASATPGLALMSGTSDSPGVNQCSQCWRA